jgi:ribonuclease HII
VEVDRLHAERQVWSEGFSRVMGLDEVGRGCLCGPVVAAGVIFSPGYEPPAGLRDSKKLTRENRERLAKEIRETCLFWSVQCVSHQQIDRINILRASLLAMQQCVDAADPAPDMLFIDGNQPLNLLIPQQTMVKGDDRSATIAAASVLAKVFRDDWMQKLHKEFPQYGWDRNVGYPTREHREALREYGPTPYHRMSFRLL